MAQRAWRRGLGAKGIAQRAEGLGDQFSAFGVRYTTGEVAAGFIPAH